MITDSSSAWLPNSEIHGLALIYSSPWLIAVSHVLRRLLMPRHSPYALLCLNFFFFSYLLLWVSQIIFVYNEKASFVAFFDLPPFLTANCSFLPDFYSEKPDLKSFKKLSVRFNFFIRFSMIFLFALSTLHRLVGSSGLEPPTSRFSGARSNLLSYEPI